MLNDFIKLIKTKNTNNTKLASLWNHSCIFVIFRYILLYDLMFSLWIKISPDFKHTFGRICESLQAIKPMFKSVKSIITINRSMFSDAKVTLLLITGVMISYRLYTMRISTFLYLWMSKRMDNRWAIFILSGVHKRWKN